MSEKVKHTPGPWSLKGNHPWMVECPSNFPGAKGKVAEVGYLPNARLIAAAPDLLAALQAVVRVADRKTDEFDLAHAAIKKAMQA